MALREHLFDQPGYTGRDDSKGNKIFVGNTIKDQHGLEVIVYETAPGKYQVATAPHGPVQGQHLTYGSV